jgi:hypothetical protein
MGRINPAKAALAVGIVIGLYHLAWVGLVAAGLAKPFMDFVLKLHFIQFDYGMSPFDAATGAMLVALTFTIGSIFGLLFALVWNWLAAKPTDKGAATYAAAAE